MSKIRFTETTEPTTPIADKIYLYAKSDKHLYIKDDAGTETELTSSNIVSFLGLEDTLDTYVGQSLKPLRVNVSETEVEAFNLPVEYGVASSDEITDLTTGTLKSTIHLPSNFTLVEIMAELATVATGTTLLKIDVKKNGTTVMATTKVTIDESEETSFTATTPAVITTTNFSKGDRVTVEIIDVGNTTPGRGLKVWLIGTRD